MEFLTMYVTRKPQNPREIVVHPEVKEHQAALDAILKFGDPGCLVSHALAKLGWASKCGDYGLIYPHDDGFLSTFDASCNGDQIPDHHVEVFAW